MTARFIQRGNLNLVSSPFVPKVFSEDSDPRKWASVKPEVNERNSPIFCRQYGSLSDCKV